MTQGMCEIVKNDMQQIHSQKVGSTTICVRQSPFDWICRSAKSQNGTCTRVYQQIRIHFLLIGFLLETRCMKRSWLSAAPSKVAVGKERHEESSKQILVPNFY